MASSSEAIQHMNNADDGPQHALFLPLVPFLEFQFVIPSFNCRGSRRHVAPNLHLQSVRFEYIKIESTDFNSCNLSGKK